MANKAKKIGIMGGTFDPLHCGHLILAQAAFEQFELNKVLFMPSPAPPHKLNNEITDIEHRIKMIELGIQDNPVFEYSDFELSREGIIYTSETLELFLNQYPDTEIYFIIGADSLLNIEKWKNPEKIFKNTILLVGVREDYDADCNTHLVLKEKIKFLQENFNAKISEVKMHNIGISSTMIKEKHKSGKSIKYYVPLSVERYIDKNELYR